MLITGLNSKINQIVCKSLTLAMTMPTNTNVKAVPKSGSKATKKKTGNKIKIVLKIIFISEICSWDMNLATIKMANTFANSLG